MTETQAEQTRRRYLVVVDEGRQVVSRRAALLLDAYFSFSHKPSDPAWDEALDDLVSAAKWYRRLITTAQTDPAQLARGEPHDDD